MSVAHAQDVSVVALLRGLLKPFGSASEAGFKHFCGHSRCIDAGWAGQKSSA